MNELEKEDANTGELSKREISKLVTRWHEDKVTKTKISVPQEQLEELKSSKVIRMFRMMKEIEKISIQEVDKSRAPWNALEHLKKKEEGIERWCNQRKDADQGLKQLMVVANLEIVSDDRIESIVNQLSQEPS